MMPLVKFTRAISRNRLLPTSKTIQLPTRSADPNVCLRLPKSAQSTFLANLYQAARSRSATLVSFLQASQNCVSRGLEMTRMLPRSVGGRLDRGI